MWVRVLCGELTHPFVRSLPHHRTEGERASFIKGRLMGNRIEQQLMFWPETWRYQTRIMYGMRMRRVETTKQTVSVLNEYLCELWSRRVEQLMANKGGGKNLKNHVFKGYANARLTPERKRQYDGWEVTDEGVFNMFERLIMADYRCGFSVTNEGKTVQFAVTCRREGSPDEGYTMTSRAPAWFDALRVGVWKHYVLCDEDWSDWKQGEETEDWG